MNKKKRKLINKSKLLFGKTYEEWLSDPLSNSEYIREYSLPIDNISKKINKYTNDSTIGKLYEEAMKWDRDYFNSEGYKLRFNKLTPEEKEKATNDESEYLGEPKVFIHKYWPMASADGFSNIIELNPNYTTDPENQLTLINKYGHLGYLNPWDVGAHEYAHLKAPFDDNSYPEVWLQYLIKNRISTTNEEHDSNISENYADLVSTRSRLDKFGIFDSKKINNTFTKDMLNLYREKLKQSGIRDRFLDSHTDDDIINSINIIAYNNLNIKNPEIYSAKYGRKLLKSNYFSNNYFLIPSNES